MSRRGFTLLEVLMVISILVILTAIGVFRARAPISGASTQGLAQTLASQMQAARKRAISQHTYVGVAFPSAGGTRAHSQSFYFLEGDLAPKVTQVVNLAQDLADAYICLGAFPSTSAISLNPPQGRTPGASPLFRIGSWLAGAAGYQPRDYVVAFAPDGTVACNDLAWHGSQLQIVTCSGFQAGGMAGLSGTPVAGANSAISYQITSLAQPHTICLSQTGQVWVVAGLAQNDGSLGVAPVGSSLAPASPPALAGIPNTPPTILSTQTMPKNGVDPATNPTLGSYDAIISSYERMTVVVRALDADPDDHLCCNLTASGGQLSIGNLPVRMSWDPSDTGPTYPNGCWKASVTWTPPGVPDSSAYSPPNGQVFQIRGQVVDDHGGVAALGGTAQVLSLNVLNQGHIVFSADQGGGWMNLFRLSPGTNTVVPLDQCQGANHYCYPSASVDGSLILYFTTSSVRVCDADGQNDRQLLPFSPCGFPVNDGAATWSPDGTRICYFDSWSGRYPAFGPCALLICPVASSGGTTGQIGGTTPLGIIRDGIPSWNRLMGYSKYGNFDTPGYVAWSPVLANNVLAYLDANGDVAVCNPADAQPITLNQFTSGSYYGYSYRYPATNTPYTPPSKVKVTSNGPSCYYYGLTFGRDGTTLYFRDANGPQLYSSTVVISGGVISATPPVAVTGAATATVNLIVDPSGNTAASTNAYGVLDFYALTNTSLSPSYSLNLATPAMPARAGWTWTR